MSSARNKIAIVGTGLIGCSWAMVYASAGYNVFLYDVSEERINAALEKIATQLKELESSNLLRGTLSAQEQIHLICGCPNFQKLIEGALLVQENVPENLDLKRKVHAEIDAIVDDETIVATSVSTMVPSILSEGLKHRSQFVVSHPVNPPLFAPLTEVVPAPWTNPQVVETMVSMLKKSGQTPIVLKKEINGFVVNRVQYGILNEGFNLVKDGVVSPEDFDKVMSDGLGMRYAFMGPFETAHLNADGYRQYMERYSKVMTAVSAELKPPPKYEDASFIQEIIAAMEKLVPLDTLVERRKWRDNLLMKLWQLKTGKL